MYKDTNRKINKNNGDLLWRADGVSETRKIMVVPSLLKDYAICKVQGLDDSSRKSGAAVRRVMACCLGNARGNKLIVVLTAGAMT